MLLRVRKAPLLALICGWLPLLHLGAIVALAVLLPWRWGLPAAAAALYLLPPLFCRVWLALRPLPAGTHAFPGAVGTTWYIAHLAQTLFNRFPVFEELLRLVPGLYQLWLRLWGSRVSLLSVWGQHVLVTDRWSVEVARGAVIGARAILAPHLLTSTAEGLSLCFAPVVVCTGAIVGGTALLGPGCRVEAGENLLAGERMPPGAVWHGGRRHRP